MRNLFTFILLTFVVDLTSQTIDLPSDSLIRKFHIKIITAYFNDDSTKNQLTNVWKFDSSGTLISKQLFDSEDTTKDIEFFFYKNHLLSEHWHLGTWTKYDTVKTSFLYDKQKRKVRETTTGKFNPLDRKLNGFTNTILLTYPNDSLVIKRYEGNALTARGSGTDSIIYNNDKTVRLLYNKANDLVISYTYNDKKHLVSEIQSSISNPALVFHYNKFFYDKQQLVKEIVGHSIDGRAEKNFEQVYHYFYDKNGLLTKIQRPKTFDTYKYEYYD